MQRDKAISNWNDNVGNIFNHNRLKIIALMTVFWSVHWAQKVRMKVICCFAVNTLTQSILSIARVERWDVMRALSSWDVIQLLVMALVRGEAFFERNQATGNWWQTLIDCFYFVVSPSLPLKITNKQSKKKMHPNINLLTVSNCFERWKNKNSKLKLWSLCHFQLKHSTRKYKLKMFLFF